MSLLDILKEHCEDQLSSINEQLENEPLNGEEKLKINDFISARERKICSIQEQKKVRDGISTAQMQKRKPTAIIPIISETSLDVPSAELEISNTNVIDISKSLSNSEKSVLQRGLTFCPTNNRINEFELHRDITEFSRRMRLKEFFADKPADTGPADSTLRAPSTWCPDTDQTPELDMYVKAVSKEILETTKQSHKQKNLSSSEQQTLNKLSANTDIIIKPADKGGSIVILPIESYKRKPTSN